MSSLNGIRSISFDVDGTLSGFDTIIRRAMDQALVYLDKIDREAAALLDVDTMIAIRDRTQDELKGKVYDLLQVREGSFKRALREIGRPNDALGSKLTEVYLGHRYETRGLFDDVTPALDALKQQYALGLISNGNSYPKTMGQGGVFQFAVFSQDHQVEKPDRRIFQIAFESAECAPNQMLHVGDPLQNDVGGATGAGVRSAWLNRNGAEADPLFTPDIQISSLLELTEVL
jgi:FMN phosphatase YigB (HAD superfamily)